MNENLKKYTNIEYCIDNSHWLECRVVMPNSEGKPTPYCTLNIIGGQNPCKYLSSKEFGEGHQCSKPIITEEDRINDMLLDYAGAIK